MEGVVALHMLSYGDKLVRRCAMRPEEVKEIINQLKSYGLNSDEAKGMLLAWPRLFSIEYVLGLLLSRQYVFNINSPLWNLIRIESSCCIHI
jgi:hypothetical protein